MPVRLQGVKRQFEPKPRKRVEVLARADDDALLTLLAAGVPLQPGEDRWRASGGAPPHRRLLRDGGGNWNKQDGCWESPDDHRSRVRERVVRAGVEAVADDELLELLLLYSMEQVDTKPLARQLLQRFGTLGDVFAADPEQLREFAIDPATLIHFKAMREVGRRLAERKVKDMPVLTNWQQLIDYCHVALAHEKTEQFRIFFLDRKNVLIADEIQQRGTVDHTPVYPREVVKRALTLNASALILVHNHPSGDPKPSRDDIEMTREVKAAAAALGIVIHDHLVIGRKGHASFRSLGLL